MNIKEILCFRIPQFIQFNLLGYLQSKTAPELLELNGKYKALHYKKESLNKLFQVNPFSSKYSFFTTEVDLFAISDWRKDFQNNKNSPLNYYHAITKQDFDVNGDVKFVLEVSRFHFLPFFAFKAIESEDSKHIERITEMLGDWVNQNPYLRTINWTSGIEVGIRSVNLIYTHNILKQFNLLSSDLDTSIRKQLSYNYQFLKHHLSLYSSANNHLMAELMGLVAISSYFSVVEKEQEKWKNLFFKEILNQVNTDGVHMELCTRYHAEVTDQILIGLSFLKNNQGIIPKEINGRFQKMFEFTQHVTYKGVETIFGDNDEGFVINPYFVSNFSLYDSQLCSANYLFDALYHSDQSNDFRNYLIFGESFQAQVSSDLPENAFFNASGYGFMYDHESEIKLSFDVGKIGDAISAAHGHSDLFHFTMQQGNAPLIVDSGTYQYHSKSLFWRDYFRGITAHNTISINNKQHATMNNRMSWIDKPTAPVSEIQFNTDVLTCKSIHEAFITDGVTHERCFLLNKITKQIEITDRLINTSEKKQKASFYLHFHPESIVELEDQLLIIRHCKSEIKIENKCFEQARIEKGNKEQPFGWFSNSYNVKRSSKSLCLDLTLEHNIVLITSISYA